MLYRTAVNLFVRLVRGIRNRHLLAIDLVFFFLTPLLALWLRLDDSDSVMRYLTALAAYALIAAVIRLALFLRSGLYSRYWLYASIDELAQIVATNIGATLLIILVFFGMLRPFGIISPALPRSIPFLDGLLVLAFVGGIRYSIRLAERLNERLPNRSVGNTRIAIIGAGDAGALMVKEMQSNPHLGMVPVVFLDDDPHKQGMLIHGVPVIGDRKQIASVGKDYRVQEAIIAMPTAPGKTIRELMKFCLAANLPVKTIPGVFELLKGTVTVNQIRPVQIEDLLRRDPVVIDTTQVMGMLKGKRVMVTGAGGSIGSELCRQIALCEPAVLIMFGHGEHSLFNITNEMGQAYPRVALQTVLADVRDADRVRRVLERHQPQVIFHAAAHKHVPLTEENVEDAITNNVGGTSNLVRLAGEYDVTHFVLISTDKAVNPSSVMGATKRVAEHLVQEAAQRTGRCYVAVRFGNVLGSRGSVVPFFRWQIARGGPVTVTHREVKRYFMTIPEAVQLVLQAAALGMGGEVFVLDMGEPIKILDLARDLIRLSGLEEGRDIDITFSGLRPGEKLNEELFLENDHYSRTKHEKIFVVRSETSPSPVAALPFQARDLQSDVDALSQAARAGDVWEIRRRLQKIVPEYNPVVSTAELTRKVTALPKVAISSGTG